MCNVSGIIFGAANLLVREVKDKSVLEVGALDVNGSLRPVIEALHPKKYVGVDLVVGPGVDQICDAADLEAEFGAHSFEVVVATEILEHVRDWRAAIHNLKAVCTKGGVVLITTRSRGHRYHGYPVDFWRYEIGDMRRIFADFTILKLEADRLEPGVFLKARKPRRFREKNLENIRLYSIVANRRARTLSARDFQTLYFLRLRLKVKIRSFVSRRPTLRKGFEIISSLARP